MFVPMCLCVCKREKERGFEKPGALCKVFSVGGFFFFFNDFPSICHLCLCCQFVMDSQENVQEMDTNEVIIWRVVTSL